MTLTSPARQGLPGSTGVVRRTRPVRQHVVAVLVSHDGGRWLPRTLAAVAAQTRAPDVVVGVDTGSTDGSADLLRDALGAGHVVEAGRRTGFGDAVRLGLAHLPGDGTDEQEQDGRWVWLLHDDAAPEPTALAHLMDAATVSAQVGVVGPKLVGWDDRSLLLEAGLSVGRDGRRHTGVVPGERDQGQHDHRTDVLAVGTAGMLVSRDLWDRLGGLDPALPLLRDDIDLCWRAHLSGRRVVLAPRAVVADAQASTTGRRPVDAVLRTRSGHRPDARTSAGATLARVDRRHGLQVALARCSWPALPLVLVGLVLGGLARSLALLLAKAPRRAFDELTATAGVALTPWRWLGSRWRARGTRTVRRRDVSRLLTPRWALARHGLQRLGGLAAHDATAPGHATHPTRPALLAPALWRRVVTHPLGLVVLLLAAATAVVARGLVGRGVLAGGELRPATGGAESSWHAAVDAWAGAGLGGPTTASPLAALRALAVLVLSPVAGGAAAATAVEVLLLGAPVLAAVTAYVGAGCLTGSRWVRAWAGLAWAGSPLLAGAVGDGRTGPVAATVLLPLVARLLVRALAPGELGRWTAAFAAALGLAVLGSLLPALLVAAAALLVGVVTVGPARGRALLVLLLTPALLGPWVATLALDPLLLLAGPGAVSDLAPEGRLEALTSLVPVPAGLPGWFAAWVPLVLVAPVLLAGLCGLLRGGRTGRALAGAWALGLLGLAAALLSPSVVLATTPDGALRPWAGSGLLLLSLVAVGSAVAGVDGLRDRLAAHRFAWRQVLVVPVVALAVLAPMVATAAWSWRGLDGLTRSPAPLPAVAVEAAQSPAALRTLRIDADGTDLTHRLEGAEPGAWARDLPPRDLTPRDLPPRELSSGDVTSASAGTTDPVAVAVRALTGGAPEVAALRGLAVAYVLVEPDAAALLGSRLDTVAGLTRLGSVGGASLWRVVDPGARVTVSDGGRTLAVPVEGSHAAVGTTVAAGASSRRLVLAEPAAPGWRATLDGEPLEAVTDEALGWRQVFELPAASGRLTVSYDDPARSSWLLAQAALAVVVLLLALPGRRDRASDRRGPVAQPAPERVDA